ncbi:MAG TPA: hypothetical protein VF763_08560 [Candidatus Limnocylindrales bacterium]
MRRPALIPALAAALFMAACGSSSIPPSHFVDGYRLGTETSCAPVVAPHCDLAIATARDVLLRALPQARITATSMAEPGCNPADHTVCIQAGLAKAVFVVFDLSDGSRHAIGLSCTGDVFRQDGALEQHAACQHADLAAARR